VRLEHARSRVYSNRIVSHSLVLALFADAEAATVAARALHVDGIGRDALSVVARSHDEEGALARLMDATPGAEMEDSRPAARLGEIGATMIAAAASVMPGVAPLLAAGPLSAEFGEAAGHAAGGLGAILSRAGIAPAVAARWEAAVSTGQVLLGVHVGDDRAGSVEATLRTHGALETASTTWPGEVG
jgi:hypothetical protein